MAEEYGAFCYKELDKLFKSAKEKDECEYILTLLRVRGEQGPGWDPLRESHEAIQDYLALIDAPLREITKARLAMLTYCHITEIDAVYEMLANMMLVVQGERYSIIPFEAYTTATGKRTRDPIERIDALKKMESDAGGSSLAAMFTSFFDNKLRNAFYHSNYILFENKFRYFDKGIAVSVPLERILESVERAVHFYLAFAALYVAHRMSYTEPKIIRGRLAPGMDIKVLVEPGFGLVGLQAG